MAEYYGVRRDPDYLKHLNERGSGAVAVYKNHKYIARAPMASGKYRYFYKTDELAAYKNNKTSSGSSDVIAKVGSGGKSKKTKKASKANLPTNFGNAHLSSGALTYKGESDTTNYQTTPALATVPTVNKKKKKKSKKSRAKMIIDAIRR